MPFRALEWMGVGGWCCVIVLDYGFIRRGSSPCTASHLMVLFLLMECGGLCWNAWREFVDGLLDPKSKGQGSAERLFRDSCLDAMSGRLARSNAHSWLWIDHTCQGKQTQAEENEEEENGTRMSLHGECAPGCLCTAASGCAQ